MNLFFGKIYYIYFLNSNKYLKNNHLFNLDIFSTSANILTIVFLTSYYIFINFKDSYLAYSIEFYNSSITYIKNSWSSVDFIKLLLKKKNISIFKKKYLVKLFLSSSWFYWNTYWTNLFISSDFSLLFTLYGVSIFYFIQILDKPLNKQSRK